MTQINGNVTAFQSLRNVQTGEVQANNYSLKTQEPDSVSFSGKTDKPKTSIIKETLAAVGTAIVTVLTCCSPKLRFKIFNMTKEKGIEAFEKKGAENLINIIKNVSLNKEFKGHIEDMSVRNLTKFAENIEKHENLFDSVFKGNILTTQGDNEYFKIIDASRIKTPYDLHKRTATVSEYFTRIKEKFPEVADKFDNGFYYGVERVKDDKAKFLGKFEEKLQYISGDKIKEILNRGQEEKLSFMDLPDFVRNKILKRESMEIVFNPDC